ncbi:MAG: hypothetical protein M3123_05645, partial [Actinomycetota bacterium]|nr:hypothetical protein [Actinomycetota bacterium]
TPRRGFRSDEMKAKPTLTGNDASRPTGVVVLAVSRTPAGTLASVGDQRDPCSNSKLEGSHDIGSPHGGRPV